LQVADFHCNGTEAAKCEIFTSKCCAAVPNVALKYQGASRCSGGNDSPTLHQHITQHYTVASTELMRAERGTRIVTHAELKMPLPVYQERLHGQIYVSPDVMKTALHEISVIFS
jgi:hypothetical protein